MQSAITVGIGAGLIFFATGDYLSWMQQLVLVLGHSHCGAIAATVDALIQDPEQMYTELCELRGQKMLQICGALEPLPVSRRIVDRRP